MKFRRFSKFLSMNAFQEKIQSVDKYVIQKWQSLF